MRSHKVLKRMSSGVVGVSTSGHVTLWTRVKLRKQTICAECGLPINKGEAAFSPIGNTLYRYERVHAGHWSFPTTGPKG